MPAPASGAAILFLAAIVTGHNMKLPRGEYIHIMVAGLLNVAGFQVLSGFAQLSGATSRAIIITYSMPIWTIVLSWLVLGERFNTIRWFAFGLCIAGNAILLWPLFTAGFPPFVFYSLGCALTSAIATVYIKWAESYGRAAGQRGVAIVTWARVHRHRELRFRRLSAALAAADGYNIGNPVRRIVRRWPCTFPMVVDVWTVASHDGGARIVFGARDRESAQL